MIAGVPTNLLHLSRSEEHTSELQSRENLVCRLLLEKKKQPLVSLVRMPSLNEIRCPTEPDQQCTLEGTNLFLIESIASDAEFKHPVPIPAGFMDTNVTVPRTDGSAFCSSKESVLPSLERF